MIRQISQEANIPLQGAWGLPLGGLGALTIIIPVYNAAETLDECLGSLVAQTLECWELILVDDGSTDACPQLCDQWAERDSRIRVVHRKNGGLSAARNTGLELAQGQYITFVDADDYVDADTYRQLMELITAEHADMVEYPVEQFDELGTHRLLTFSEKTYADCTHYFTEQRAYRHFYSWNKIYARHLFDTIRFPEGKVFEDAHTTPRLISQSRKIVTTSRGLYHYRQNPNGITHTATGHELAMLLEAYQAIMRQWPAWVDDDFYVRALNVQLDVCRMTGCAPTLPPRHCGWRNLKGIDRIKAITANLFGIKTLCWINKRYGK